MITFVRVEWILGLEEIFKSAHVSGYLENWPTQSHLFMQGMFKMFVVCNNNVCCQRIQKCLQVLVLSGYCLQSSTLHHVISMSLRG